jgi:hypothetical protein
MPWAGFKPKVLVFKRPRCTPWPAGPLWMVPCVTTLILWNLIDLSDDGGSMDLWNAGKLTAVYTALQPRRQPSSYSPPWEPQVILEQIPVTVFKKVCQQLPLLVTMIHTTLPYYSKIRNILILSYLLHLSVSSLRSHSFKKSRAFATNTLYPLLSLYMRATACSQLILHDFVNQILTDEWSKL